MNDQTIMSLETSVVHAQQSNFNSGILALTSSFFLHSTPSNLMPSLVVPIWGGSESPFFSHSN
jgi:hypothetical protein